MAVEGLRGYTVGSLDCPTEVPIVTPDRPSQPITGEVQKYVLCPSTWGAHQPHGDPPAVAPGSNTFAVLDRALRRPDAPYSNGPCPAMAMAPRLILAQTTDGDWDVHIPTNDCGFYPADVMKAFAGR